MSKRSISFNGFLTVTDFGIDTWHLRRPRVVCADGYTISIQRSYYHYCDLGMEYTKMDTISYPDDISKTSYELGYPSREDDLIMEYAETPDYPTGTVYGFVPYDVVVNLLEKHGGIVDIWKASTPIDDLVEKVIDAIELGIPEETILGIVKEIKATLAV